MNKLFSILNNLVPHAFFLAKAKEAAITWIAAHIPEVALTLSDKLTTLTGKPIDPKTIEEILSDAFDLIEVTLLADGSPAPAGTIGVKPVTPEQPSSNA